MSDLIHDGGGSVATYERGKVSFREIAKGVLTRFLPASAVSLFGVVLATVAPGNPIGPVLSLMTAWTGWTGLGFALGLLGMKRWLYPDAKVSGLRAVLAGALAPLLPLALLRFAGGIVVNPMEVAVLLAAAGVVAAVMIFFPWLTPTPEHMRGEDSARSLDEHGVESLTGGAP